jgi:small-conductance mechanosensitive channel
MTEFLQTEVYGNALLQWLVALGITTVLILAMRVAKPLVVKRLKAASQRTSVAIDDAVAAALDATRTGLIALVAVEIGSRALTLPTNVQKLVDGAATLGFFIQVGLWASALLQFWITRSQQRAAVEHPGAAPSLSAIGFVGRIVLWAVVVLLALDNLGINITTLVAGLGIGGVAVALAVQNILGDLFASLSIVIDKPFVVGDFIIVDDYMGTVEHIGLKTTRIRSLSGEQLIFSNGDLLKTRLRNYKRMRERRIVFKFGVTYDTPPEKIEQVPPLVRRLVEAQDKTRFERAHFFAFGESSLDFEVVFWMTTPDYNLYMDVQQNVNLALMREFGTAGIEFAFPTRTLHIGGPLQLAAAKGNGTRDEAGAGTREPESERKPGRH